jgi:cytosine deaminase
MMIAAEVDGTKRQGKSESSVFGLAVGCNADFVVLQARDPIEAIRLKAHRLAIVRRGKVIARSAPRVSELFIAGRPAVVDASTYAPPLDRL